MMRVHLLTTRGSRRAHAFVFPLRVFARQLKQAGLDVRLFYQDDAPALTACDVLGVVSDYFGIQQLIARPDDVVQVLMRYRDRVKALIWFDVTDGTGTLFEPAFAQVDVYAKKQLLQDRTLYKTPYFEREYHLHYYYENYGEQLAALGEKARIVNHRGLTDEEIERFALSWNIGLENYHPFLHFGGTYRPNWLLARLAPAGPNVNGRVRPVHIAYRVGTRYLFPAVPFHRLEVRRRLTELAQQRDRYVIRCDGGLRYRAYMKELTQTCIAPSPFGWGEICWRDFEAFTGGALLFKPDMDHLETWPAYYEKDVTYVAHRWDFTDIQEKIEQLLDDPGRRGAIAEAGQDRFLATRSPQGGDAFVRRVNRLLHEARQKRQ